MWLHFNRGFNINLDDEMRDETCEILDWTGPKRILNIGRGNLRRTEKIKRRSEKGNQKEKRFSGYCLKELVSNLLNVADSFVNRQEQQHSEYSIHWSIFRPDSPTLSRWSKIKIILNVGKLGKKTGFWVPKPWWGVGKKQDLWPEYWPVIQYEIHLMYLTCQKVRRIRAIISWNIKSFPCWKLEKTWYMGVLCIMTSLPVITRYNGDLKP